MRVHLSLKIFAKWGAYREGRGRALPAVGMLRQEDDW